MNDIQISKRAHLEYFIERLQVTIVVLNHRLVKDKSTVCNFMKKKINTY